MSHRGCSGQSKEGDKWNESGTKVGSRWTYQPYTWLCHSTATRARLIVTVQSTFLNTFFKLLLHEIPSGVTQIQICIFVLIFFYYLKGQESMKPLDAVVSRDLEKDKVKNSIFSCFVLILFFLFFPKYVSSLNLILF